MNHLKSLLFILIFLSLNVISAESRINLSGSQERFSCVFISSSRIEVLKERIQNRTEPTWSAYNELRDYADKNITRQANAPENWYVPGYYRDAEGHTNAKKGLQDDANAAYALALCYKITGKQEYALAAVRIINTWVVNVKTMSQKDDSRLSFSYHFPALIFAADLLREDALWQEEQKLAFSGFLRQKALTMSTITSKNNWGNWGLVLSVSCAVYLQDETLFDSCVKRWQEFIELQIADDGHLDHEVNRSEGQRGIWYSHFCLMPQTIAAEILRINGTDLFDYESPSGHTLKAAYERIAEWTLNPASFPYWQGEAKDLLGVNYYSYFEILNNRWSNQSAGKLLKKSRPQTARHSAPFLTFTHGEELDR